MYFYFVGKEVSKRKTLRPETQVYGFLAFKILLAPFPDTFNSSPFCGKPCYWKEVPKFQQEGSPSPLCRILRFLF